MNSGLSRELQRLCEQASHELDSAKLLKLAKEINELFDRERKPPQSDGKPGDGDEGSKSGIKTGDLH